MDGIPVFLDAGKTTIVSKIPRKHPCQIVCSHQKLCTLEVFCNYPPFCESKNTSYHPDDDRQNRRFACYTMKLSSLIILIFRPEEQTRSQQFASTVSEFRWTEKKPFTCWWALRAGRKQVRFQADRSENRSGLAEGWKVTLNHGRQSGTSFGEESWL